MVTFVTLILSLITGPLPVEVAVDGAAAEVELLLDGESVGVDRRPPWRIEVDFGTRLRPHVLVAVARDADGHELGRARQRINLPRPRAEVDVLLERDDDGVPVSALVIAENAAFEDAYAVSAILDGRLVPVDREGRMSFGPLDTARPHVLSVEAEFVDGTVARRDVSFGGSWGSQVRTDLTAVAVTTDRRRAPAPDEIAGMLRSNERPVRVAAIEQPGHRLFVVRDQGAWPALRLHGARLERRMPPSARGRTVPMSDLVLESSERSVDAVHLVHPVPDLGGGRPRTVELFPVSDPLATTRVRRLDWLLGNVSTTRLGGAQRLAHAVAVAGVRAAGASTPRAVVVVLSGAPADASAIEPATVRGFLADLNVPLYVWRTEAVGEDPWGDSVDVSTFGQLRSAIRDVERDLDRQWLAWLEGEHLPHQLTMRPSGDLALAGVP